MKSNLGGLQMHLPRSVNKTFELAFSAPKAGTYELSARVVTVHWKQKLLVDANGSGDPTEIALPYTIGEWQESDAVKVQLVEGDNALSFSRTGDNIKGITIRDFTLTPSSL